MSLKLQKKLATNGFKRFDQSTEVKGISMPNSRGKTLES